MTVWIRVLRIQKKAFVNLNQILQTEQEKPQEFLLECGQSETSCNASLHHVILHRDVTWSQFCAIVFVQDNGHNLSTCELCNAEVLMLSQILKYISRQSSTLPTAG